MGRTTKTTTTELTDAEQDRIARTITPICRKCGSDLTPEQIGSTSREGKTTCKDCLPKPDGATASVPDAEPITPVIDLPTVEPVAMEPVTAEPTDVPAKKTTKKQTAKKQVPSKEQVSAEEKRQRTLDTLARARAIRAERLAAGTSTSKERSLKARVAALELQVAELMKKLAA